jgi:alpha-tubulin suppressor-like RCC1 family protein
MMLLIALSLLVPLAGVRAASAAPSPAAGTVQAWGDARLAGVANPALPSQVTDLSLVKAIAGGFTYSLALRRDGTVWAWGVDTSGQLGDGTIGAPNERTSPVRVVGLTNVTAIAAGAYHNLALKSDGTVWAWGYDLQGQLGDGIIGDGAGGPGDRATPSQVVGLGGVTAISAGNGHSLALKADGTVWSWGANDFGQLGNGDSGSPFNLDDADLATPVQVVGLSSVTAIAAGDSHSLALKSNGTVWAWGKYAISTAVVVTPRQVVGLVGVTAIAAGYGHSLALVADGTVWAWGFDYQGQLGDGTADSNFHAVATQVVGLSGVAAIAAGGGVGILGSLSGHSLALKRDGTVWAWGYDNDGQLGDGIVGDGAGGNGNRATPVQVVGLSNMTAIAGGYSHSLALQGDAPYSPNNPTPGQVPGLPNITALAAGTNHSLVLAQEPSGQGSVWAWGADTNGQLGDGTVGGDRSTPTRVVNLTGAVAIAAGGSHSLALTSDGTVWAWGANSSGQLGSGTIGGDRATPQQIPRLTEVAAIAAGGGHSLALKRDGSVWAWGSDRFGQLGDGTIGGDQAVPAPVASLGRATAISAGTGHSLAVLSNGTVWAWGNDRSGQLGDGTVGDDRATPAQVVNLGGATAVAAGGSHSLALKSDGTVWAWGSDTAGQLGDGTLGTDSATASQVVSLTGVAAIAAGSSHSLAVQRDGSIVSWGADGNGQLGDGEVGGDRASPRPVVDPTSGSFTGVRAIAAGGTYSLALKSDGTVWAWGSIASGQLGGSGGKFPSLDTVPAQGILPNTATASRG